MMQIYGGAHMVRCCSHYCVRECKPESGMLWLRHVWMGGWAAHTWRGRAGQTNKSLSLQGGARKEDCMWTFQNKMHNTQNITITWSHWKMIRVEYCRLSHLSPFKYTILRDPSVAAWGLIWTTPRLRLWSPSFIQDPVTLPANRRAFVFILLKPGQEQFICIWSVFRSVI